MWRPALSAVGPTWTGGGVDEIAFGPSVCPDFLVDIVQALAADDPQGDLVGELFGLQIRMVGENPDVTELVGDDGLDLILA